MKQDKSNIRHILLLGTLVPVLLVIGLGLIALNQFSAFEDNKKWVDHTHEVLIEARYIEKLMVDIETGQRGFIITGKENFLEPFHAGREKIFEEIQYLKNKVNDNPVQVARLSSIENKINNWFRTSGYPEIEARRKYDRGEITFDDTASLVIAETGKKQIDALREILATFISVEEGLVIEREAVVRSNITYTKIILMVGVALIVLIIVLVGLFSAKLILDQNWINATQAKILKDLQEATTLEEFSETLLSSLMPVLSAQIATIYGVYDGEEIYRIGAYGSMDPDEQSKTFKAGQGLVGQCFSNAKPMHMTDIPENSFEISSSLGQIKPKEVLLFPIIFKKSVTGVIELASLTGMKKRELALINMLSETLGVGMRNILSGMEVKTLRKGEAA